MTSRSSLLPSTLFPGSAVQPPAAQPPAAQPPAAQPPAVQPSAVQPSAVQPSAASAAGAVPIGLMDRSGGPATRLLENRTNWTAASILATASTAVADLPGSSIGHRRLASGSLSPTYRPIDKRVDAAEFSRQFSVNPQLNLAPPDLEEGEIEAVTAPVLKELEEGEIDPETLDQPPFHGSLRSPPQNPRVIGPYLPLPTWRPSAFEESRRLNQSIGNAKSASEIEEICHKKLDSFNELHLTTALYRLVKIYRDSGRREPINRWVIDKLSTAILGVIGNFNSENLSKTAWALASLGIRDDRLMSALAQSAESKILEFDSKSLSNTAWAFAKLTIRNDQLMRVLAHSAEGKIGEFNPQALANTAWAFAKLGICERSLMRAVAQSAELKIGEFKPKEVANLVWAFASLSICESTLMRAAGDLTRSRILEFNPQDLSNIAWSFATLGIRDDALMRAVARAAETRIAGFNPQDLANTVWAFATLGIREDGLLRAVGRSAESQIARLKPQDLSHIAWAFAVLEHETHPIFRSIAKVLDNRFSSAFSQSGIYQLMQAQSALKLSRVDLDLLPSDWNLAAWSQRAPTPSSPVSQFQLDVGIYLRDIAQSMGRELRTEHFASAVVRNIDFTIGKIAFEVDGFFHFATDSREPLGSTLFRNRLLRLLGWKLVCIPQWEWDQLKTAEAKHSYLDRRIREVLT